MKAMIRLMAIAAVMVVPQLCTAQAPAGAPAGSTALCNDGTYFSGATKSGACRGHKGIKTWFGADAGKAAKATPAAAPAKPAAAPAPAPAKAAPAPTPTPAPATKTGASAKTVAPGGGPGQVWVNTSTNVYHCPGSEFYGKTKAGAYMTEDQAKAKGARADHGKACSVK